MKPGRTSSGQTVLISATLALCLAAIACGHRGNPRPPVYPAPPPILQFSASQVGTDAVLHFSLPPLTTEAGSDTVEVSTIEVLVYAERYPVLDLELLATSLERHRDLIIEDAVAAAEAAAEADRLEAIRDQVEDPEAAAAAVAAAQAEAAEAREEEEESRRVLDPDQRLIYHISPSVRDVWRNEGVTSDVILDAARKLEDTTRTVWRQLGLPTTVLDPSMPMSLPDAIELAELADVLLAEIDYEREIPLETFLARAGAPQRISYEEAEDYIVEDLVEMIHPIGIPAPDEFRTRFFFAARSVSEEDAAGEVETVISLAPSPVPLSPTNVTTAVGYEPRPIPIPLVLPVLIAGVDETQPAGVNVSWDPPPGDVWGRLLETSSLVYNVYRIRITEDVDAETPEVTQEEPSTSPLNTRPLDTTSFIDRSMEWGEQYVYEVRAMVEPPLGSGVRESVGARSAPVDAIDTFPPEAPTGLQVVRAGSQIRLQWRPAAVPDLLGYRIYRHVLPAPSSVDDSWDVLTPEPIGAPRFLDSTTESSVRYVYAVVSVDEKGNISEPLIAEEPGASEE